MLRREASKRDARAAFAPLSVLLCVMDLSNKRHKLTTVCFVMTKTTQGSLEEATVSLDSLKVNSLVDL